MTHAVLPVTALRRASRSVTPSAHGTVFTGRRGPAQYVSTTRRARGDSAPDTTICSRSVVLCAISAASASAEPPSYREAFVTSMPVSSQIMVWYS